MSKPRDVLYQGLWFPLVCSWIAIIGIVVTSASKTIYGEYLWNPISIIDMWDGPGGRAAAFFCGVSWLLAQMCINISATVVSGANDMVNLWPQVDQYQEGHNHYHCRRQLGYSALEDFDSSELIVEFYELPGYLSGTMHGKSTGSWGFRCQC